MTLLAAVVLAAAWVFGAALTAALTGHRGLGDPDEFWMLLLYWPIEYLAYVSHALARAIRRWIE